MTMKMAATVVETLHDGRIISTDINTPENWSTLLELRSIQVLTPIMVMCCLVHVWWSGVGPPPLQLQDLKRTSHSSSL